MNNKKSFSVKDGEHGTRKGIEYSRTYEEMEGKKEETTLKKNIKSNSHSISLNLFPFPPIIVESWNLSNFETVSSVGKILFKHLFCFLFWQSTFLYLLWQNMCEKYSSCVLASLEVAFRDGRVVL